MFFVLIVLTRCSYSLSIQSVSPCEGRRVSVSRIHPPPLPLAQYPPRLPSPTRRSSMCTVHICASYHTEHYDACAALVHYTCEAERASASSPALHVYSIARDTTCAALSRARTDCDVCMSQYCANPLTRKYTPSGSFPPPPSYHFPPLSHVLINPAPRLCTPHRQLQCCDHHCHTHTILCSIYSYTLCTICTPSSTATYSSIKILRVYPSYT